VAEFAEEVGLSGATLYAWPRNLDFPRIPHRGRGNLGVSERPVLNTNGLGPLGRGGLGAPFGAQLGG
jgi:hypothetical protein